MIRDTKPEQCWIDTLDEWIIHSAEQKAVIEKLEAQILNSSGAKEKVMQLA